MTKEDSIPLSEALDELCRDDVDGVIPSTVIYRLGNLGGDDLSAVTAIWPEIPARRRKQIIKRLHQESDSDFELNFRAMGRLALGDTDESVRSAAIASLWEDQSPSLLSRLHSMLTDDPSEIVRGRAARGLGRFVLLSELGKFPDELVAPAREVLLRIVKEANESPEVQRRALESIAYTSLDELPELIEDAYYQSDPETRASAVFAMGRSCDLRWSNIVLNELESEHDKLRFEAARTAGDLELEEAIPLLIDLLEGDDVEIRAIAIWALGEIGGGEVRHALSLAAKHGENESLIDDIEDALAMAALSDGSLDVDDVLDDDFQDNDFQDALD